MSMRGARSRRPLTTSTLTTAVPSASMATKLDSPRAITAWMSPTDSSAPGTSTGR